MSLISLAEFRLLPDAVIRVGIRRLLRRRLAQVAAADRGQPVAATAQFAAELRRGPIALATAAANEQHYEVPAQFFQTVLGKRLKYSCGYWPQAQMSLDESEDAMLELTCRRAAIEDGMEVLDLGCGWGSLTLWLAERYPACRILALSNSRTQRAYIEQAAEERNLANVEVVTANVAEFATERQFDRIVSIEMFEHVRNYERLLARVASWLRPGGNLLVHIFCHRRYAYLFENHGQADWMAQHFFTGGIMPSADLLREFNQNLSIAEQWHLDGTHYHRTCEAWLRKLDENEAAVLHMFRQDMSARAAAIQLQRWRMFFMACSELFRFREGTEWGVAHYRLNHTAELAAGRRHQTPHAARKINHSTAASA